MTTEAALRALDAAKRPCHWCGRVMLPNCIVTHEPTCSPEAREERRAKVARRAWETRRKPGYVRPRDPRDACPSCGSSKLVKSTACRKCERGGLRPRPLAERFWEKVDRRGPDVCWPWTGATNHHGYGAFSVGHARARGAHRVAYELTYGPLDAGFGALHRCDNPPCCNPAHLFRGTQADNVSDMVAKGRHGSRRRRVA